VGDLLGMALNSTLLWSILQDEYSCDGAKKQRTILFVPLLSVSRVDEATLFDSPGTVGWVLKNCIALI